MPVGAVGLIGLTFAGVMGYVEHDPNKSLRWMLSGFAESTVWLIVGAFVFAIGYRKRGLGRRIALVLVRALGRHTIGLGYAVALSDLVLAPATPSNTARSGGTIYPIVSNIPKIYGSEPGPTAGKIGTYVMWTAFATTAVTSSLFLTALAPNAAALSIAKKIVGVEIGWSQWFTGFAPLGIPLLLLVPLLSYVIFLLGSLFLFQHHLACGSGVAGGARRRHQHSRIVGSDTDAAVRLFARTNGRDFALCDRTRADVFRQRLHRQARFLEIRPDFRSDLFCRA